MIDEQYVEENKIAAAITLNLKVCVVSTFQRRSLPTLRKKKNLRLRLYALSNILNELEIDHLHTILKIMRFLI